MNQRWNGPDGRTDALLRALGERQRNERSGPTEARMRDLLAEFRQDLREHPYVRKIERREARRRWERSFLPRPLRAALTLACGAVLVAALIFMIFGRGTTTWAALTWSDVVERFQSVTFFSATIYMKDDALGEVQQRELWMGRGGRVRMRVGSQVLFAEGGKVTKAFDVGTRRETKPDAITAAWMKRLGGKPEFSLDAVLDLVSNGRMSETTPRVNAGATISNDLVVFDITSDWTPEWARIWALAESRLPVRLKFWDPRDGDTIDASFTYSKEQQDEFFSPEAFEEQLRTSQAGPMNTAYANLKDPGGRTLTPGELFERTSGYHVPKLKDIGMTPEGAVWVVSTQSRNRTPDGRSFHGFGKLEDDLGRTYVRSSHSYRPGAQRSLEIFIPEEYPFDPRMPEKMTLICAVPDNVGATNPGEIIGTVEVTDWEHDARWPVEQTITEPLVSQAYRLIEAEEWDKLDRTLALIPGEAEESDLALDRERLRLAGLTRQGKYGKACEMGERLWPLLVEQFRSWSGGSKSPNVFNDYIVALALTGRIEEAKEAWRRVERITPELADYLNAIARERVEEGNRRAFDANLRVLAGRLHSLGLKIRTLNMILGVDVRTDKRFDHVPAFRMVDDSR